MLTTARSLFSLLREIDFAQIQNEAQQPVRLVLLGDEPLVRQLLERLGPTPWVSALPDLASHRAGDVILRLSSHSAPSEPLPQPGLDIVVGETSAPAGCLLLKDLSRDALEQSLAAALLGKVPDAARLALARQVPLLRAAYARALIEQTSRGNALYAASTGFAGILPVLALPLNVADLIILSKNQLIMAYKLALLEGKQGQPSEMVKEILSVLGGGLIFRQLARELVGLIPGWGIVPKVAVAYAGTQIIGETVHIWAAGGETATLKQLRQHYETALERGRSWAEAHWKNPGIEKLEAKPKDRSDA
jgi:uncharacterized protein (DUF697 family)